MNTEIVQRIEKRLKNLGLSANAASQQAGLSKDAIRNWQRNPELMPTTRSLIALAAVLQTTVKWLMGESEEEVPSDEPKGIRYGGIVEAGTFRRVNHFNQDADYRIIPLAPDPRYPAAEQYAFEVWGDSMNLAHVEEGMWVQAVTLHAWEKIHGEPVDGKLVIVAFTRSGDAERELTVKRLRIFRDRIELQPESTNPSHKAYVFPNPPRDHENAAQVIAVVLTATRIFA